MKIKKVVKLGDILKIPAGPESFAVGQVILQPNNDFEYIVVFEVFLHEGEESNFQDLVNAKALILAQVSGGVNTSPKERKWEIIGNTPIRDDIAIPEYKVSTRNGWMVTNWKREILRTATDVEIASLGFHTSYSSAAIEKALKAYLGLEAPGRFYESLIQKN